MNSTANLDPVLDREIARRTLNLLEAGEVVRFHATPKIEGQTVGHHSYGVAVILIAFGALMDPEDRWMLAEATLHDTPELYTGDAPFIVKRDNQTIKDAMDLLEMNACIDHLFVSPRLSARQHVLLKLADMLDGLRWCLYGHERGTPVIAGRWVQAILKVLTDEHHRLNPGEVDRVWAVYQAIRNLDPDFIAEPEVSFHTFLQSTQP